MLWFFNLTNFLSPQLGEGMLFLTNFLAISANLEQVWILRQHFLRPKLEGGLFKKSETNFWPIFSEFQQIWNNFDFIPKFKKNNFWSIFSPCHFGHFGVSLSTFFVPNWGEEGMGKNIRKLFLINFLAISANLGQLWFFCPHFFRPKLWGGIKKIRKLFLINFLAISANLGQVWFFVMENGE